MLKRCVILMLCLLYTVSVYGVAFNVNYCGTEIQSVKMGNDAMAACPMCHGKVKMKCCKTKHVDVKVKDAHLVNPNTVLAKVFTFAMVLPLQMQFVPVWQQAHTDRLVYHAQDAPPPDDGLRLIKNCNFRI